MMKSKKLRWLGAGVLLLAVAAWALDRSGLLLRALEPGLRQQASKATQGRLTWASLDGGLFGSVHLRQPRLEAWPLPGGKLTLGAETLTLKVSLWDLLIVRKSPLESLRRIDFESAHLRWIGEPEFAPTLPQPLGPPFDASRWAKGLQWPSVGLRLLNSHFIWVDAQGQTLLAFENLRLGLDLERGQGLGHLSASARDHQGGRLNLSANVRPQLGQVQGVLNLEGMALPPWASGPLTKQGFIQKDLLIQASLAFQNSEQASEISWGGLRLNGWMKAKARSAQGYLEEPELWLQWEGRQVNDFRLKAKAWGGKLALVASGGLDEAWLFRLEGTELRPAGQYFESMSATGQVSPLSRSVKLYSFFAGDRQGAMHAQGSMDFSGARPKLELMVDIQKLALKVPQDILLSGSAELRGDPMRPQFKAQWVAPELSLGSLRFEQAQLSMDLVAGAGWLSASAGTDLLGSVLAHGRLALSGTALALDNLILGVEGKPWARAWARLDRNSEKAQQAGADLDSLDFKAVTRALNLPLNLKGQLKGRLAWSRQLGHSEWKASVDGPDLSTQDGRPFSFLAKASSHDGVLMLERLALAQGQWQAKGLWAEGQGIKGIWRDADLGLWAAALHAPWLLESGRFSGDLSVAPSAQGPEASLELEAHKIKGLESGAESLQLSAKSRGAKIELLKLEGRQGEGASMKASGVWDPEAGQAQAEFKLKQWKVKGKPWDGEGELQSRGGLLSRLLGSKRAKASEPLQGDASWRHWKVSGHSVPDLSMRWEWQPDVWAVKDLSWDAGLRASYSSSSHSAKAWLRATRLDGAVVARLMGGKYEATEEGLDAEFFWERDPTRSMARLQGEDGRLEAKLEQGADQHWQGQGTVKDLAGKRLAEWLKWAGVDMPRDLAQRLDANLIFDSSAVWPLSISLSARSIKAGIFLGDLKGQARLKKQALELSQVWFGRENGLLHIEAASLQWHDPGPKASLTWSADGYEIAKFRLKGKGRATWQGQGKSGKARMDWSEFIVNDLALKTGWLEAQYSPEQWLLNGSDGDSRLHAQLRRLDGRVEPEDVTWKGTANAELSWQADPEEAGREWLDLKSLSLEQLALGLGWGKAYSGRVNGHAALRRRDGKLEGQGSLRVEKGRVAGIAFDLASGNLEARQGRLILDPQAQPFVISNANSLRAELSGSLPLGQSNEREEIDARVAFPIFDLAALAGSPAIEAASGTVNASLRIKGTLASPEWNGRVELSRGLLAFRRLLAPLEDLYLSAVIEKSQVQLLRADARVGEEGQQLQLSHGPRGEAALVMDGLGVGEFNLALKAGRRGMRLRGDADYDFINGICYPDLLLLGDGEKPRIEGRLKLEKATVTYPPRRRSLPDTHKDSFLARAEWDLLVDAGASVRYTGIGSNLEIQAQEPGLRIHGPGKELKLEGRVMATRGRLNYLVAEFDLDSERSSSVEFRGDLPPNFDLWGIKTVRRDSGTDLLVRLHLSGPLDQIQATLSSDERDLTQAQMASYVGLGEDLTNQDVNAQMAVALIGRAGLNAVFGALKRNRTLDDISLRMPGLARALAQSTTSTAVTQGLSGTGRAIVELVMVKNFGIFRVKAVTGTREAKSGDGQEVMIKGGIEVPISKHTKIEAESGSDESRVGVRSQSNLENYDPKKRKRELDLKKVLDREARKASPTPSPQPSLTSTPEKP